MRLMRDFMADEGFLEIETPILCKSTPEGAETTWYQAVYIRKLLCTSTVSTDFQTAFDGIRI